MKFLRHSSWLVLTGACLTLQAIDYNYYAPSWYAPTGALWTSATIWTQVGAPPPVNGVPDSTSNCFVLPQNAGGDYTFIINDSNCLAKSFQIPSSDDDITIQFYDGVSSGYSSNFLKLSPGGSDGLYFNNTPGSISTQSTVVFEHCNLQFLTNGSLHNEMYGFFDQDSQYITSELDIQNNSCVFGNNVNLDVINATSAHIAFYRQTILGSDSSGNNTLASLNFYGLLGTFSADTSCLIGNKVPLITVNSNIFIIADSQFGVGAGALNFQSGNISIDSQSFLGPAVINMTGGLLTNANIVTFGSYSSGAYQSSNSSLSSGSVIGGGSIYFAGNANITIPATQGNWIIGSGLDPTTMSSFLNAPSIVTLSGGALNGNVSLSSTGTLTGNGFVNGAVFNSGMIANNNIVLGASSPVSGALAISNNVTMTSGKLAVGASSLSILQNILSSDANSIIGPTPLSVSGGNLINNGSITLGLYSAGAFAPSSSTISSNMQGSGNLFITGSTSILGTVIQGNIKVGQGLDLTQNPVNAISELNLLGSLNGTLTITSIGSVYGSGIVAGNIVNSGLINPANLVIGNDVQTSFLDLNSPTIISSGVIGSATNQILFVSGNLSQSSNASFAYKTSQFAMEGGSLLSDVSSLIGPCPLIMSNGQITNNGSMSLGFYNGVSFAATTSNLNSGSLLGSGILYVTGTVNVAQGFSLSQNQIVVGEGLTSFNSTVSYPGALILSGTCASAITLGPLGTISGVTGYSTGTFTNNGDIAAPNIAIGYLQPVPNCLTLSPIHPIINNGIIGSASTYLGFGGGVLDSNTNSSIGTNAQQIVIQNGSIGLSGASFGFSAGNINMSGGTIILDTSSQLGLEASLFQMSGGYIQSDASSIVGPFPVYLSGGIIDLAGTATIGLVAGSQFLASNSTITAGTLTSLGSIYFAGNTLINGSLATDGIVVGQGFNPNTQVLMSSTCTFSINGTVQSKVFNQASGSLSGNHGFLSGSLSNYGNVNPKTIFYGANSAQNASITIAPFDILNITGGRIGLGSLSITMSNGSISNNQSFLGGGNLAQSFYLTNGSIFNISGGTLASSSNSFNMSGGYISNDNLSTLGPVCLNISNGVIANSGTIILGSASFFGSQISGGTIQGAGQIQVLGTAGFYAGVNQSKVIIGTTSNPGALIHSAASTAQFIVNTPGVLLGNGTINGTVDVLGILSPGTSLNVYGSLSVNGDVNLYQNSQTQFYFGPSNQYTKIAIDGNLYVNGSPTLFIEKQKQSSYTGIQTFTDIFTFIETDSYASDFIIVSPYKATLIENSYSYDIQIEFSSLIPNQYPGNAGVMARNLDTLNGNTNLNLQDDIDVMLRLGYSQQLATLLELCPQFKLIQYSLEKLLMGQSDLFQKKLETLKEGLNFFVDLGFDQYAQDSIQPLLYGYHSYRINSWIEDVGLAIKNQNHVWGLNLGYSQSFFRFPNYPASARYNTVLGLFGYDWNHKQIDTGIRLLSSYSMIQSQRHIHTFEKVAKNKHDAWNVAGSWNFGYKALYEDLELKAYNDLSFVFGKEMHDQEKYADELNLIINNETLAIFRNALGLKQTYKKSNLEFSLDLAWVYENILSDLRYKGRFVNTNTTMNFYATPQRSQFAKAGLDLLMHSSHFDTRLSYQGLFSKKFIQQTAQLNLMHKF